MMRTYTYDEWKAAGYHVIKGRKSCGRNDKGQAVFSEKDVEEDYQESDWDEEELAEATFY